MKDRTAITADSFSELLAHAMPSLTSMGEAVGIVCGPISTGGRGTIEENLRAFGKIIDALQEHGLTIFDQRPYEDAIFALRTRWLNEDPTRQDAYCMPILDEFYHPLYTEGPVTLGWFMPDWQSSRGARWEHDLLLRKGADIRYLDPEWTEAVLEGFSVEKPVYRTRGGPG